MTSCDVQSVEHHAMTVISKTWVPEEWRQVETRILEPRSGHLCNEGKVKLMQLQIQELLVVASTPGRLKPNNQTRSMYQHFLNACAHWTNPQIANKCFVGLDTISVLPYEKQE